MTFIARLPYKVSHSPFPSDVDSRCGGVDCWPTSLAIAALTRPSHSCSRQTPSPSFAAAGPSLCTTGWGGEERGEFGVQGWKCRGRAEDQGERRGKGQKRRGRGEEHQHGVPSVTELGPYTKGKGGE